MPSSETVGILGQAIRNARNFSITPSGTFQDGILYILIGFIIFCQCSGSLNEFNQSHQFGRRGFYEGFFKLLRCETVSEKGLHFKTIIPASDCPLARQVSAFYAAIPETDLMAQFGAADLLFFIRCFSF